MHLTQIEDEDHIDDSRNRVIHEIEAQDAAADEWAEAADELEEDHPDRRDFFKTSRKHRDEAVRLNDIVVRFDNAKNALTCNDDPEMRDELKQAYLEAANNLLREAAHL